MEDEARVSVVMTVFNEADNIGDLIDALLLGTEKPSEIVIADGGSTDGTVEIIKEKMAVSPEIKLIENAGDRSSGRNLAIAAASHDRIAAIDAGGRPRPDWLEHMSAAFDRGARWVGGFYEAVSERPLTRAIGLTMVYVREEAERHFVPSARSLGFTRDLWQEVGGFPSGVQFAEDTLFAERLFERGYEPTFVPEAIVDWHPPRGLAQQWKTMYRWGHGDGVQGLRRRHYLRLLLGLAGTFVLAIALGIVDLGLAPLAILPGLLYMGRTMRLKFKHMEGASRWILIPVAALNGTLATLAGFIVGTYRRRR
ncbi:MAG TPA: glycosyltransferase [Acidimicrobiia bacterium]|nr:glycosyltransferase [Acidimicrobiia bacterium]